MAFHPKTREERILHRLQIARGHLEKVILMYQGKNHCIEVLHQSNAVQRALKEADHLILENHLETCVVSDLRTGNTKQTIEEIMGVLRTSSE